MAEINVVPYVDVMLVLLVIFMITAPLLTTGVEIELPKSEARALKAQEAEPLVVSVDAHGKYYLNVATPASQPITSDKLLLRLAAEFQRAPNRPVLVRGDQSVPYGQVIEAMVLVQKAGAPSLGLVTDSTQTNKG